MMEQDFDQSLRFLKALYPEGPWMLTAISTDKKSIESRTFRPETEQEVRDWLHLHRQKNLYYSVNEPVYSAYESKKLRKSDVRRVYYLHVDVDPRDGEDIPTEQRRIHEQIMAYRIEPTWVIFSGGGYNALWELESPVDIAEGSPSLEETLRRAIDVERRNWQFELDFQTPDHCRDVSRILRLPGSINRLNAEKIKKGRVTAASRIVHASGKRYPLSAFMATQVVADNAGNNPTRRVSSDIRRIESLDHLPRDVTDRLKIIITHGHDPDDKEWKGDRSGVLFYVCCELVRCGVEDDVILGIITDRRFGISESVLDKGAGVQRYALRQVSKARDKAFDPLLAEFNEKYAVIANLGGRCMIMIEEDNGDIEFQKPQEFAKARDHEKKEYTSSSGKIKMKGVGSWWFDQRRRRQYEHVVFEPGMETSGDFNLWRGFAVDAVPGDRHLRWLDHLKNVICQGNEEQYQYLLKWFARCVQNPRSQSMVVPVILGVRGTGKSILTKFLCRIFGRHSYVASDVEELTGKFNAHLKDCVFFVGEEAFTLQDRRYDSVLKERITGSTMGVEFKGIDRRPTNNYLHIVLTSNSEKVVPAGDKERRYVVVRVGEGRRGDRAYFNALLEDLNSTGPQNLLYHLLQIDLSGFIVTDAPQTAELRKQQEHNLTPELDWLLAKLESGVWTDSKHPWEGPLDKQSLYNDYVRFCDNMHVRRLMSERQFARWLKQELGDGVCCHDHQLSPRENGSRPWGFRFASLELCRLNYIQNRGWDTHEWPKQQIQDDAEEAKSRQGEVFS